ncbi:hypothetical protein NP493_948g00057 [Ridgeia piscesae]|uniref:Uncharacterized protein n=1 Tax=Ridgeia piscesae TaxID=27915 RepID=A0AAD9NMI5_RIDPI|nr:hypothetical protein NP493_948g00057 [Ridgeia piscesae]
MNRSLCGPGQGIICSLCRRTGYCINKHSLHHICAQIRVEAILYTLVREASTPLPCPFHGAYRFRYNENSGGFCENEASQIRQCASDAHFRFLFRPCAGVDYSFNKDVDFQCVATWKAGSDTYLYGKFSGDDVHDKDDAYRCFMYETLGSLVQLAVSADATCRGLRSPSDGPLVMELTRDASSEVAPSCVFPRWLTRSTWRDLAGRHVYSTDASGEVFSVALSGSPKRVTNSYRCVDMRTGNTSQTLALSSASDDCQVRYQCIKIIRRHRNVLEIHKGRYVDSASEVCSQQGLATASVHTIIPTRLASARCPYIGKYLMEPGRSTCKVDVVSGCDDVAHISIVSSCVPRPVGHLECLQTWTEDNRKYVIARRLRNGSPGTGANCFSFEHKGGTLRFTLDRLCNHGAPSIFNGAFRYTLQDQPEACDVMTTTRTIYETPKKKERAPQTKYIRNLKVKDYNETKPGEDAGKNASYSSCGDHTIRRITASLWYIHATAIVLLFACR